MTSVQLHRKLRQTLQQVGLRATRPQLTNVALLVQALAYSPNCHLPTLALYVPLRTQAANRVQRLRRLLKNRRLAVWRCYRPLVRHLFAHWTGREVNLVMDRTDLANRCSILALGAVYRKRFVPLTWQVLPFGGSGAARQQRLLQRIQPLLPPLSQVRVHFYGDSEFRAVALQRYARRYGWHWQVALKRDLLYQQGSGPWRPLATLTPVRGQRRYVQAVRLTQQHAFGPVNLIADWTARQNAPRFWSLDQRADRHAWRRGRKRFWIEPGFRDWKSSGFDLERSQVTDAARLNMLVLGIALANVWLLHLGAWLRHKGRRRDLVAAHKPQDRSLFHLGRAYLQRAQVWNASIPVGFTLAH